MNNEDEKVKSLETETSPEAETDNKPVEDNQIENEEAKTLDTEIANLEQKAVLLNKQLKAQELKAKVAELETKLNPKASFQGSVKGTAFEGNPHPNQKRSALDNHDLSRTFK